MEKEYAQALFNLQKAQGTSAEDIVEQLTKHLRATGRQKLLPRILQELRRLQARASTIGERLEVASEAERARAEADAGAMGITASAHINSDLVSGWRAQSGSRVIDRSGKRALLDLYRSISAHS